MSDKFRLRCLACAHEMADADVTCCPVCGGTLDVIFPEARQNTPDLAGRGLWRYFDLLPIRSRDHIVTLGETETPVVESARLGKGWGVAGLHFKVESMMPTGSYKDRIAAVSMARALEMGKTGWGATSSGNAGAALAAYGVRAGLQGNLFVLEKASRTKIAQILTYRPRVMAVRGLGVDPDVETQTFENVRRLCARNGWMMVVTARRFNPFGMEGVKTLAFEICEQLGRAPDVVYVPVGGGGLLSTCWKGFNQWQRLGRVSAPVPNAASLVSPPPPNCGGERRAVPRMVAVQGEGCSPVVDAWQEEREARPIAACRGGVSGLQLAAPPDGALALSAVRESQGWAVAVPDANTYRVQGELASAEGLFVEPAAAISAAAVEMDRASGRLRGDETIVCLLTGIGFKVMDAVQSLTDGFEIPLIDVREI